MTDTGSHVLRRGAIYAKHIIPVELVQLYKALGGGWELTYPGEIPAPAIDAVHAAQ